MNLIDAAERRLIPDSVLRLGIRRQCAQRLRDEHDNDVEGADRSYSQLLHELRNSAIAIETDAANAQHYELPARFFELCLGEQLKYSACYYPRGDETLDQAERAMLALYGERAQLVDGQDVLELGCGWGSFTLWMAEHFPRSRITAVSNSHSQRAYILGQAQARGLANIRVITCDVNVLDLPADSFDRVVSVEMFEHVRNYEKLLANISRWLRRDGQLFVHIFCHRNRMYRFETDGDDNWMGRHFFTGGLMPAADTLLHFQQSLLLQQRWLLSGAHYRNTANHWLQNQDRHHDEVRSVLASAYGVDNAALWVQRWRMFWMACAELFGYRDGQEWLVAHYRFVRP